MKEQKEELTLTVLAAGMGSRFGGLKQLEPVGPNGEFIIDYTVYDAIQAGFDKVVFIIRKEIEEEFKNTIGARIEPFIKVEYAYQDIKDVPEGVEVPENRTKPLGTSQALWCARNNINGKFAIVSADDFYGRDALIQAANHAKNSDDFSIIGYKIGDTLSNNGSVKRGICLEENGHLQRIVESKVERKNGVITCEPLNGEPSFTVEENHPVSMLLTTVDTRILPAIEKEMPEASKEVLLVLDAETGQNAISQVKAFKEEANITGLVLTKLDGTAKGGVVIGIVEENKIPVKFIGVGEQIDDMEIFNSEDFVKAII